MDGHRACLQILPQEGPLDCAAKENLDPARDPDEDPRTRNREDGRLATRKNGG
ncbi:hypothetical protein D8674_011354 [Pyrus ussuriensis x Pyrus communis]|uniref:Uncharacterized protein n=1 Tax=Pyrus ussuriensis x Pyrus communis TaxID=2448454 RepID=A0A5N5FYL3_9ROSA|nr:hypothetical protein D8674_011354 [Pyrus ussuriensis x Pyrus communis]